MLRGDRGWKVEVSETEENVFSNAQRKATLSECRGLRERSPRTHRSALAFQREV